MLDLSHLPEHLRAGYANPKWAPANVHVKHRTASWPDVYVPEVAFEAFCEEVTCHLQVPPVWTAYEQLPKRHRSPHPIAWTWGFLQARQLALPIKGVFTPLHSLDAEQICHHPDPQVAQARLVGFMGYIFHVEAQRAVVAASAAA